ncbi:hypothetical protein PV08_03527 [Exophiala spinifera]|uniref:NCT transcriptional regulatory complex subunit A n=1 Tax=Exophiala spinifera TaxID=91928 RepID=A0A0D2BJY5_9EURO|nr:uncharacterized protein PV08_03527 [Exophiala spinifera]KIW19233.1 hypothetical protein PV08_03527 [Exophiala spinifera]
MSNPNNTNYRPKSPNLSGVHPPPKLTRIPSYHPEPEVPADFPVSARGSYDASPFFSPQSTTPSTSYFASRPSNPSSSYSPQAFRTPSIPTQAPSSSHSQTLPHSYDQFNSSYHPPPQTHQPFDQNYPVQPHPQQSFPFHSETFGQLPADMPRTRRAAAEELNSSYDPNGAGSGIPVKMEQPSAAPPVMPIATTDPSHGIDVRTKFPVARIKRIMQADEDVGKVAQATPTAVSKALELFMITLVMKGAAEAKGQHSKRVTAQHLKAALMKDGQFDFLTEICESVPDEGSKKGRAKSEAKSEDSDDEVAPKKKAKGGKKRKADSDDSSD